MKSLLIIFCFISFIQLPLQASRIDPPLTYLVRKPKVESANPPLILLLHGRGGNEYNLFAYADKFPDSFLVISVRAPITLSPESFAWFHADWTSGNPVINKEEEEQSRQSIIDLIQHLHTDYAFDPQRVYLCGFSQGAIMSYGVALTRPDLVHGIAVMSGRLLDEIKPLIPQNESLAKLNFFISHGTQDQVLKIDFARSAIAFLKSLHIRVTYKEYKDGHTINSTMFADMIRWLNQS